MVAQWRDEVRLSKTTINSRIRLRKFIFRTKQQLVLQLIP